MLALMWLVYFLLGVLVGAVGMFGFLAVLAWAMRIGERRVAAHERDVT